MAQWDRTKGRPEPIASLNKIVEIDNGEPLVDLSRFAPSLVILRPQVIAYLRLSAAQMVEKAAKSISPDYKLGVIDSFRPFHRQVMIYEFMTECALKVWPDLSYSQLRRKVNRFVAPVDQKAPPGHCTGAAIDLYLLDKNGNVLDVCSPYDRFTSAPTYTKGLSEDAFKNRMILVEAMLNVGFSNCRDEWWHYSYGDAGWAVRNGLKECIYGLIELDKIHFEANERLWTRTFQDRKNPFAETGE